MMEVTVLTLNMPRLLTVEVPPTYSLGSSFRIILVGHLRAGGHMQRVLEDAVSSRKPVRWIGPGDRTPDWLPTSNHEETLTEALRNNRSAP